MSKDYKWLSRGDSMRALPIMLLLLFVLAGCSGMTGQRRAAGSGVSVQVINYAELGDVYFPYYIGNTQPTEETLFPNQAGQDYIQLFQISTLVRNPGYANSLVAMYVTGYDPNWFVVQPLGPYIYNEGPRYCYTDVIYQDSGSYEGYVLCDRGGSFVGGGIGYEDDQYDRSRVDLLNVNAGRFLDTLPARLRGEMSLVTDQDVGFFESLGVLNNLNIRCAHDTDGISSRGGINLVDDDNIACDLSFGFPGMFYERASRGSLLLALFGGDVRHCANGCTIVPSPNMPRPYLSGDNENTPGGEAMYVDFGVWMDRAKWPANMNDHDQLFQITACYLYTTYATPIVCLDPTPALSDGEVCRPGVIDMGQGQPAPLSITKIVQHNQGTRAVFEIHVENTLNGRSFHPGAIDFCSPSSPETYARELRDVAKVVDARVLGSLQALDCRDGLIYLRDGKGQITCSYDLPPEALMRGQAYQTTLNIEIGYLYRDIQTVQASIHRT